MKDPIEYLRKNIAEDEKRQSTLFLGVNLLIGLVSFGMSVVNIFTEKWLLLFSTSVFSIACLVNVLLSLRSRRIIRLLQNFFLLEVLAVCSFFCISGTPEGFSALWFCFVPSFSFSIYGMKKGICFSGIGFLIIAFLLWTPLGQGLLHYEYTASFMLRFPMLYIAFVAVALFIELIRFETQKQLQDAKAHYHFLYKHDSLTGVFNRYGFNAHMDSLLLRHPNDPLTLMILDIDHFKFVNDTYGHERGDHVLRFVAKTMQELSGKGAAVSRWGGEEFTMLIPETQNARRIAEEIRSKLDTTYIPVDGESIHITVSIGVCMVVDPAKVTPAMIVKGADKCLYEAKDAGRNKVAFVEI